MNQDMTVILVPFQESDFEGNDFMNCQDCAINRALKRQVNGVLKVEGRRVIFSRQSCELDMKISLAVLGKFLTPSLPLPAPFLQEVPTSCLKSAPQENESNLIQEEIKV